MIQVDPKYQWVLTEYHWYLHRGYATSKVNQVALRLHVVIAELEFGKRPDGYVVHHINEDKLDNRVDNLRIMSRQDHSRLHATDIKRPYMIERNTSKDHIDKIAGDNCYMSKVTDQRWLEAIELYLAIRILMCMAESEKHTWLDEQSEIT